MTNPFQYYLTLPDSLEFYLFDSVVETRETTGYINRMNYAINLLKDNVDMDYITYPIINTIASPEQLEATYDLVMLQGFEGLVLHSMDSPYKYGRSTLKEQYFLKLKPSSTFEAIVIDINERMMNFNESQTSSLGYSFKASNKDNKEGCGIAATATVKWEDKTFKITLKGTESERAKIWDNKEKYIGRRVLFNGMAYGMKDIPRFPRFEAWI